MATPWSFPPAPAQSPGEGRRNIGSRIRRQTGVSARILPAQPGSRRCRCREERLRNRSHPQGRSRSCAVPSWVNSSSDGIARPGCRLARCQDPPHRYRQRPPVCNSSQCMGQESLSPRCWWGPAVLQAQRCLGENRRIRPAGAEHLPGPSHVVATNAGSLHSLA
jgi:hypothetical protein